MAMKKVLLLMMAMLAVMAAAHSQVKLQFVEAQLGQAVMAQGMGFSLFDKAVDDNIALGEALHVGWGKSDSHTTGVFLDMNVIEMPGYDEFATAVSLGIESRSYTDVTESLRCYSGTALGGVWAGNLYTLEGAEGAASRWGVSVMLLVGAEKAYGEHLYFGVRLHLSYCLLLSSTYKPTEAMPPAGDNLLFGNKVALTMGYRF